MEIKDRIVDFRRVPASELRPNPKNWRIHPDGQKQGLKTVLAEIGMADAVIAKQKMDSAEQMARLKQQIDVINARIKAEKNDIARGELLLQKEALVHQMLMNEPTIGIDEEGKTMSEVLRRDEYGLVPGAEG